jgi:orotidine-5'-phosphate decarboxylase
METKNTEGSSAIAALKPHERIVVALDVETGLEALALVDALRGTVGMFKVGKQLFTAEGPALVHRIVDRGERVFLDLKYHDIPATVAKASVEAARLGVAILNVHASGGREMLERTAEAVAAFCEREGRARPIVLAVTVLTSLDDASIEETGVAGGTAAQVVRLARLARECGIDGVVASPLEIARIRSDVAATNFVVLTPGIRPAGSAKEDQKRVMTPGEALAAGSDYLVIGRPITAAPDPVEAARTIAAELADAREAAT